MRTLRKEKKVIFVGRKLPPQPVLDENRNETGEYCNVYDTPKELKINVKPITDVAEINSFGEDVNSILKAVYTTIDVNKFEISEFDALWIGIEPNENLKDGDPLAPMNNNYFVYRVLDTGGQICAYFKKKTGTVV